MLEPSIAAVVATPHTDSAHTVALLAALREQALEETYRTLHYTGEAVAQLSARLVTLFDEHRTLTNVLQSVLQVANTITLTLETSQVLADADFARRVTYILTEFPDHIPLTYDASLIIKNLCLVPAVREAHVGTLARPVVQSLVSHFPPNDSLLDPVGALQASMSLLEDTNAASKQLVRDAFASTLPLGFSVEEANASAHYLLDRSLSLEDALALAEAGSLTDALELLELHLGTTAAANLLFFMANLLRYGEVRLSVTAGLLKRLLTTVSITVDALLDEERTMLAVSKVLHHLTLSKTLRRGLQQLGIWRHCIRIFNAHPTTLELRQFTMKPLVCLGMDPRNHKDVPVEIIRFLTEVVVDGSHPAGILALAGEATGKYVFESPDVLERFQAMMAEVMGESDDEVESPLVMESK